MIRVITLDLFFVLSGITTLLTGYILTTFEFLRLLMRNSSIYLIIIDLLNLYSSASIGYYCYFHKIQPLLLLQIFWFIITFFSFISHIHYPLDTPKEKESLRLNHPDRLFYGSI